jgi:hypothetical protein
MMDKLHPSNRLAAQLRRLAAGQTISLDDVHTCAVWLSLRKYDVQDILQRTILFDQHTLLAASRCVDSFVSTLCMVCEYHIRQLGCNSREWCAWWISSIDIASQRVRQRAARTIQHAFRSWNLRRHAAACRIQHAMLHWHYQPHHAGAQKALARLQEAT